MKNIVPKILCLSVALSLASLIPTPRAKAQSVDKQELLGRIRVAYYNPRNHGLKSFRAIVHPQIVSMPAPPGMLDSVNAAFNRIRFSVVVDSNNNVNVAHAGDPPAAYQQLFANSEKGLSDLLHSWIGFVLMPALAGIDSSSTINTKGLSYIIITPRLTDTTTIVVSKDLVIHKITHSGTGFLTSEVTPHFTMTKEGLLFSGSDASFITSTNTQEVPGAQTSFEYEQVHDLQLPKAIHFKSSVGDKHIEMMWTFSDYDVNS